jgi:hypothetical protein
LISTPLLMAGSKLSQAYDDLATHDDDREDQSGDRSRSQL